ncbi:MAG: glycosyltransferase family 25 protein [Akkermansia sp.]
MDIWDYVEAVLVINMDRSVDRWQAFQRSVEGLIPPERLHRISAVPGVELPGYGEKPWFRKRTESKARQWAGVAGCAASHRRAIAFAKQQGYRRVLILEDDAEFTPAWQQGQSFVAETLSSLTGPFLFYLGYHKPNPHGVQLAAQQNFSLWRTEGVLTTHAYMISEELYDLILRMLPQEGPALWPWVARYRAYDTFLRAYISTRSDVATYLVYPTLINQSGAVSDISTAEGDLSSMLCRRPPLPLTLTRRLTSPLRALKIRTNSLYTLTRNYLLGFPGLRKKKR